ncbi:NYN domain-containing protein [Propionivibrio sp.]|uniref:NYN domain-containing protein n=1 Tax=Propionivibrio sp. TaxID=2212460 RepID=UPI003BF10647
MARADKGQGLAEKIKHDKALETAKAELARLTKSSDREHKERKELQNQNVVKQLEIDRLLGDLLAAHKETRAHQCSLLDAQKELAELQTSLQRLIDEGISKALTNKLRHWIEPVLNTEVAVASEQRSDLLARSAAALVKQRSQDIHYGNRAELTRMIAERRQMLADVQRARIEALNPLPELTSITTELERAIGDLSHRLGPPDEHLSATVSGLLARINAATSLDALSEVRKFIQEAASYGLLDRDELHQLYRATDNKAGLLYDKVELLGKDNAGSPTTRFFLRHAIAQGHPFTLFIDGHNVLYTLKDLFLRHFLDDRPGPMARTELANCLTSIFFKQGADVMLYFDGNDPSQQSLSDQVRVFYSGGAGAHRADEAILKHLMHYVHSDSSAPLCLVTHDADFARQASAMGVSIIHPEEFATSLDIVA